MAMESGTKLGHYEIVDLLGKGGMGEVYRARDTKLDRDVAIKVLPAEFGQDADRLGRLEREARMLAALNHPNIGAIYGLGESADVRFLVLELVGGETLADRLKHGAIPIEEALRIALQISEALEAAHAKGVVHRDLKPANIKITPDGRVKVLDFGLAKAIVGDRADLNLSNSPTLSMAATEAGIILGTAAYMSPEQASGEIADHRADVWAFGVVLFEMLTGRPLFTGKTAAHIMGAVLNVEPDWSVLPSDLHPRLRVLLERLLEKEPKDRLSGISDARVELQKVLADPSHGVVTQAARPDSAHMRRVWVAVALAAALSVLGTWLLLPRSGGESHGVVRVPFVLPDGQQLTGLAAQAVDISRDGRMFAYTAGSQLYVKALSEEAPRLVQGADPPVYAPRFSPDGLSIVYLTQASAAWLLKRIPVGGGAPVTLWEGEQAVVPEWNRDDTIFLSAAAGIMRIPATGGEPVLVVQARDGEALASPRLLRTGDILYTSADTSANPWDSGRIFVQSPGSDDRTLIREGGGDGRYLETGHLVYAQGNALYALRFDPGSRKVTGGPTSVVDGIVRSSDGFTPTGQYAVSDNGTLVQISLFGVGEISTTTLAWADRDGEIEKIELPVGAYGHPRLSPDGTKLAFQATESDGRSEVWVYDRDGRSQPMQLTQGGNNSRPIWSPDSRYVTFMSTRDGTPSIWWKRADGSEDAVQLTHSGGDEHQPDAWSPDGESLVFTRYGSTTDQDIEVVKPDSGDDPAVFVKSLSGGAAISPNGKWMAYRGSRNLNDLTEIQVYLQPFPEGGPERSVSRSYGGVYAIFASDTELVYRRPSAVAGGPDRNELVSVDISVAEDGRVTYGSERVVPIEGLPARFGIRDYDVIPGDERLLLMLPAGVADSAPPSQTIKVVLDWFDELKERVPIP